MEIEFVGENSSYLEQVIALGEKHKSVLGFFPYGAYSEQARRKKIIAACISKRVIGYILFNINQKSLLVSIVHLCIDSSFRNQGIAETLINEVMSITRTLHGIRVHCRRDYKASSFWPKFGFIAIGEKAGKALKGSTITTWWYDYGQPSILQYANDIRTQSKTKAVIDANIFYEIQNNMKQSEEVQGLLADWIEVDIELCLTIEIYNEVNRNKNKKDREKTRKAIETYCKVASLPDKYSDTYDQLRPLFPERLSTSDESDLRQLTHTVSSEIPFFITRDKNLLKKSDKIYIDFNTRIIQPSNFIILHDSLIRASEYQPSKLEGSIIQISRLTPSQYRIVEQLFREKHNERKSDFIKKLNQYVSSPLNYDIKFLTDHDQPIAFIVIDKRDNGLITVPFFRVIKNQTGSIIAKHLTYQLIKQNSHLKRTLIRVTDSSFSHEVTSALMNLGFTHLDKCWIKANINGLFSLRELRDVLSIFSNEFSAYSDFFTNLKHFLKNSDPHENNQGLLKIERILFPVKIKEIRIPCYIVPIEPKWAMSLFDYNLSKQTLFGGDPSLLFNIENIYYRSCNPKLPKAPGRILWYITKGNEDLSGVMSIRACSYVNEVFIDKPKYLFKRYCNLGVYKWPNVYEVAKQKIDTDVMAFLFDFTEQFEKPITKNRINDIWKKERNRNFFPRTPIQISPELFYKLYNISKG